MAVARPQTAAASKTVPYRIPLASKGQRWQYRLLVVAWLAAQAFFWSWWLRDDHVVSLLGMLVNSLLLVWTTFLPAWMLFFLNRANRPNPALPLPQGRVAMVVTKAPSEPWSVVRTTLEAMLAQEFPRAYDVWLADEDPSPTTRAWCAARGVQVSCRKGVPGYNNPSWPRREKCKEGNLSYFYEIMGAYDRYDFVAQLDADHVPAPTYLVEMVRPFADPSVGYVAAPSVCDANASASWATRGRLFAEAPFHGAFQSGFNGDFAPQCIGSHYAVRTRALRDIGGLGPELAEDFSTTVLMNAGGWRGAFAIDAAASGDGPASVADCMTQEFQWSRSVTNVYLSLWSNCRDRLPFRARLQLGFGPIWYVLYTLHLLVGYLLPILALALGTPWVSVDLPEFLLRAAIPSAVALLTVLWIRRLGWLRPHSAPVLSWEAILYEFVRWPWMAVGIAHALVGHLTGKEFTFRVTPKGSTGPKPLPAKVLAPYAVIVAAEAGAAIVFDHPGDAIGYAYLALFAAFSYVVVIAALLGLQLRENRRNFAVHGAARVRAALRAIPLPAVSSILVGAAIMLRGPAIASAFVPGLTPAPVVSFNGPATAVLYELATAPSPPTLEPVETPTLEAVDSPTAHLVLPMELLAAGVALGAYDPQLVLTNEPLALEHWYVQQDDPTLLAGAIAHARSRRTLMVTIEPWPANGGADANVLGDIAAGKADTHLRQLARVAAANQPQTLLVRWGHEMELTNLYPWGAQDPETYKLAYRRVVEIFHQEGATNVRFVWSPAGNDNALDYFPGGDVVDYVGMTALADAGWDAAFGLPAQSFDDIVGPRYRRLEPLGKPVIVAELGVSGSELRQAEWLSTARQSLGAYPQLEALVYFAAKNPPINRLSTQPDWRLSTSALNAFMNLAHAGPEAQAHA